MMCTYSCVANNLLILATCSLSSMSLSPRSPLSFLLVGLMGGGPVLWLETEDEDEDSDEEEEEEDEDRDREWSLGSALKAASPVEEDKGEKKGDAQPEWCRDVSIKAPKSPFFFLTNISQNLCETAVSP